MSRGNDPIEMLIGMMLGGMPKQLGEVAIEYVTMLIAYDPDGQNLMRLESRDKPNKLTRTQKRDFCREMLELHVRTEEAKGTLKTTAEDAIEEAYRAIDESLDSYYDLYPERRDEEEFPDTIHEKEDRDNG